MPDLKFQLLGLAWAIVAAAAAWFAWTFTPSLLGPISLNNFRIPAGIVAMMLALSFAELIHEGLRLLQRRRSKRVQP